MVKVEIRNLRKAFSSDSRTTAPIDGLSLEMPAGGITAVIGRSGCGKTTLLRLLAGLEKPDSGEIRMEDAQGRAAAPRTAVVFQEHRLFPWMSVRRNVEVAVSPDRISAVTLVPLSDSVAAMYPLMQPSMDALSAQILESQSLEGLEYPAGSQYTSMALMNAIKTAVAKAALPKEAP